MNGETGGDGGLNKWNQGKILKYLNMWITKCDSGKFLPRLET